MREADQARAHLGQLDRQVGHAGVVARRARVAQLADELVHLSHEDVVDHPLERAVRVGQRGVAQAGKEPARVVHRAHARERPVREGPVAVQRGGIREQHVWAAHVHLGFPRAGGPL